MERFHILTLGCKVNQYESQAVREAWSGRHWVETDEPAEATVILVNSCAVTASAVADFRKAIRRLRRLSPAARLIVTGCAAHLIDGRGMSIVDPRRKDALLLPGLPATAADPPPIPSYMPLSISGFRRSRPVVKVQDGCSHRCAYCIVPLTRGPSVSRPVPDVIAETRRLFEAGYAEVMLSGINLRQCVPSFWTLLAALEHELAPKWRGRARLRLSSLDPAQLTGEGLETLASATLLCHHLHISLQSGSPSVLRRMGRGHYDPQGLIEAVSAVRSFWPVFGLGADILAGFPGETEAEAMENLDVVNALPLTYAHVFPYSERPGTRATFMPDAVPVPLRKKRAATVRACVDGKRRDFLASLVGTDAVMATVADEGGVLGCYAPCRCDATAEHTLVPVRVIAADAAGVTAVPR